jgi:spore coat polysaccharide biosynthesis protein SpsF
MVVIIVQARMGSTRLPGKVLKPIAGRPMLSYQIERLRRVKLARRVVVATSDGKADDDIAKFCAAHDIDCTRGSEHDVLARFCDAAQQFNASTIVRVTADCPLIDPDLIDRAISTFLGSNQPDYLSNMLEPSWPYGMAVEVMTAAALHQANREAQDAAEREHVTPFIYWRPERYRLESLTMTPNLSRHRWTVDTPEDFELITRILKTLYVRKAEFSMDDVLCLLEQHPDWTRINELVQQKSVLPSSGKA